MWCCLRDYKVGWFHDIYCEAIRKKFESPEAESIIKFWKELALDQLELPGDSWTTNEIFKNKLLSKLIDFSLEESITTPQIVRTFYEQMKVHPNDFYPAQMDVLFDFLQRMCIKGGCMLCPFGKFGADLVCNPSNGKKMCPVLGYCCGYRVWCQKAETCPIFKAQGINACLMVEEEKRQQIWKD